jgi:hypothetical protein
VETTAEELYKAYRSGNPAAADAKYLDKTLRLKGRVLEVEQAEGGGYVLGIDTGPNVMIDGQRMKAAVVVAFAASERETLGRMKQFDAVVVLGRFTGKESDRRRMGGIRLPLAGARIVSHGPPTPKE